MFFHLGLRLVQLCVSFPKSLLTPINIPEAVSWQTVFLEVPIKIAVPSNIDPDDSSLDCKLSEIPAGKFDDVAQNKNRAISFLGNVVLQKRKRKESHFYYNIFGDDEPKKHIIRKKLN